MTLLNGINRILELGQRSQVNERGVAEPPCDIGPYSMFDKVCVAMCLAMPHSRDACANQPRKKV